MSRPLNYTTKISARQTSGECVHILADAGAEAVALQYDARQPTGLIFTLRTPQGLQDFRMPVDVSAMRKSLEAAERGGEFDSHRKAHGTFTTPEHAARVAWRVVKDWLEANLALIAAQMATLDGIMLPYLQLRSGNTLLDEYRAHGVAEIER